MQGFFFYCILFLIISVSLAVPLDGECNDNNKCDTNILICQGGKCRCDYPLYRPCNSTCDLNPRVSYEGDRCLDNVHCVDNMRCSAEKCVCLQDFHAQNGLCYKKLNSTCNNDTQCWSNYCINSQCKCPVGYETNSDGVGCRRKLVKIYQSLAEAQPSQAYCSDSSSCYDAIAECHNESNNSPFKFCKCPSGFQVIAENTKCELVESSLFSPLTQNINDYGQCGTCKDSNAICMTADQEKTCWCRAGFRNNNGACVEDRFRPFVIFPNEYDRSKYDYKASCGTAYNTTVRVSDGLCTCASGYHFVAKDKKCEPITLKWIDEFLEYGLCTHIDSFGFTTPENGLCPSPLTCQARRDKYVCSCGPKRFVDLTNTTECVYFIGAETANAGDLCPSKNAERNSTTGVCQCRAGYKEANNRRECEVEIVSNPFNNATCSSDRPKDSICTSRFGKRARFCSTGECRCDGLQSFFDGVNKRCYAPVNVTLTMTPYEDCPPQSTLKGNLCRCNAGYHSTNLRTCVRLPAELTEYNGNPVASAGPLRNEDCTALFGEIVELYSGSRCQCISTAMVRPDRAGCWYKLNVSLTGTVSNANCPPNSERATTPGCICKAGYQAVGNECVPLKVELYEYNTTTATNTTGLTNRDCIELFSPAAQIYPGRLYCVCKPQAFLVRGNKGCIYPIGLTNTDIKTEARCPEHSYVKHNANDYTCLCQDGYYASSDNRNCLTSNVTLVGIRDPSSAAGSTCVKYKDVDCQKKFGSDASCHNDSCYCNKRTSYINVDGKCEKLTSYVFPGLHEYQSHTCMTDKDCGEQENVECAKINNNARHQVCRCVDGAFLDPKSGKCATNRCEQPCDSGRNFECRGDTCVCKSGFILEGDTCVQNNYKLTLNERCNTSTSFVAMIDVAKNDYLMCDSQCFRARCIPGYRPDDNSCTRYKLEEDACFHEKDDICSMISSNTFCNRERNRCSCLPSYYQTEDGCARAVNSRCVNNEDCGGQMRCEGQRCQCNSNQRTEEDEDVYGRPIQICTGNGVAPIRFSSALMLMLMVVSRLFLN